MTIDSPAHRGALLDLISVHYLGCDTNDLNLATSMMLPTVRFTLPPLGQVFTDREQTKAGLAFVITKLPKMARHRPAGFRFSTPTAAGLRVEFITHIMSCVDGSVHAIGDIRVDAIEDPAQPGSAKLVVSAWEVRPIFFRGLITAGKLATLPRLLLTLAPFILPAEVKALFLAAGGETKS